jgi:hypothetical protein
MTDELATPLDLWRVWLESGHTVEIAAHGASEAAGWITYKALVKGTPPREIVVAAFPTVAVADWEGGEAFNGKLPTRESAEKQRPQSE